MIDWTQMPFGNKLPFAICTPKCTNTQWQHWYKKHNSISALETNVVMEGRNIAPANTQKINNHICSKIKRNLQKQQS